MPFFSFTFYIFFLVLSNDLNEFKEIQKQQGKGKGKKSMFKQW